MQLHLPVTIKNKSGEAGTDGTFLPHWVLSLAVVYSTGTSGKIGHLKVLYKKIGLAKKVNPIFQSFLKNGNHKKAVSDRIMTIAKALAGNDPPRLKLSN